MDPHAAACRAESSRGCRHPELPAPGGQLYQRDRDRIVHSTAFRRLVYKTQVFLNHEGDLFRTRLTHSLEVAQLARRMARMLCLNEDLCEAIALAHDLGHTPFGHAGQDALDEGMRRAAPDSAGFEHNRQSLRVVDTLEQGYPGFDGLNLSFETREGILKHCSVRFARQVEAIEPGGVGARFISGWQPGLEAQLCNLADEIAYIAHDIDDGVRSGLLSHEQLRELPLFEHCHRGALESHPQLADRRLLYEVIRRLQSELVQDLTTVSARRLVAAAPSDTDAVRRQSRPLIGFGSDTARAAAQAKAFLHRHLYRHPRVMRVTDAAHDVVLALFDAYRAEPDAMPEPFRSVDPIDQGVADYVAGMTDRFALREHARLIGRHAAERVRERMRVSAGDEPGE